MCEIAGGYCNWYGHCHLAIKVVEWEEPSIDRWKKDSSGCIQSSLWGEPTELRKLRVSQKRKLRYWRPKTRVSFRKPGKMITLELNTSSKNIGLGISRYFPIIFNNFFRVSHGFPVFFSRFRAWGALRALEDLNLAKDFTQLSVAGGSAWATAAYVSLGERPQRMGYEWWENRWFMLNKNMIFKDILAVY